MNIEIGRRIRAARHAAGYRSPESFAVAIGVGASTLQRWESGKTSVTMAKLALVARTTGKPLDYFLEKAAA